MEKYYILSYKYSIQERTLKTGKKVYDVFFHVVTMEGQRKTKTLYGFDTKTLAKNGYSDFVEQHCEFVRESPVAIKNSGSAKSDKTVGEYFAEYIVYLKTDGTKNKDSVIYDKQNVYELFIAPACKDLKPKDLTAEFLTNWQDSLWQTVSPTTKKVYSVPYLDKVRVYFSSFLKWVEKKYGLKNNFSQVEAKTRREKKGTITQADDKIHIWTEGQFKQFLDVITDSTDRCFFATLFYTGRRKGEVFALTKQDFGTDSITFNKSLTRKTLDGTAYNITSTKNEKIGVTPICPALKEELQKYEPQSPFFFGGDKPLAENTVTRHFEKYTALAKLPEIRMHDLRHSFVSKLIHHGANVFVVAELIGDTVQQVMETYGHAYESDKKDLMLHFSDND